MNKMRDTIGQMGRRCHFFLRGFILIVTGLLIYARTFSFDFVFDDHLFIVLNPFIKNFNNIHLMWHAFPRTRLVGMYSFALNYYFSQLHPQGYHIFNFIVHLLGVGLVWALAGLLFKITKWLPSEDRLNQELPFVIAMLYLVHPCQTQAVTYISQRFESMAAVFYLGTIYSYLCARLSTNRTKKGFLFAFAGLLTVLGILTKEVVVTVPLMILAMERILFPQKDNKKLYMVLGLGGVALYLLFTRLVHADLGVFLKTTPSESHDGDVLTPLRYFLTQMRVFLTFLRLLVLPIHQNLDYDYPASTGLFSPPLTLLGLGVIGGIILIIVKLRRRIPLIAFGLAWVLITFSINLAPRANVIFEHKLYLISFGFFLSLAVALGIWVKDRRILTGILLCMIAVLATATYQRNKVWANEILLWEDSIKNSPHKARVNASLGRVYGSSGQYDKAIDYLSRAIAISPDNITYENRGIIYSLQGLSDKALEDLSKSIAMDPNYFSVYVKRSGVYQIQHNYGAALADLQRAIQLGPYFSDAYIERGMIWMQTGKLQEALKDFQQALNIDPFNYDVLLRQGAVYYSLGRYDLALEDFTKAQALEPASGQAAQYRSYCLTKMNGR
ncbi:MAG: tetratricopeptide repeat protein [Candidatus Omnitrophica bacterium]|nr:tetratricopeptide repeat protein [Candidatus Omnitrophota bacterium]